MDKEQFKKIYYGNSNREAAKKLKVSPATVSVYAKKFGLSKPLGRGKGRTKIKLIF
jgi:transposase